MRTLAITGLVVALGAAPAHAATLDHSGGGLVFTGAPGEANSLSLGVYTNEDGSRDKIDVVESVDIAITSAARSFGCKYQAEFEPENEDFGPPPTDPSKVRCPIPVSVGVALGDGDDFLSVYDIDNNAAEVVFPVAITVDGGDGNDSLDGSPQSDVLAGGVGNDVLNGRAGNDQLRGGAGNDRLTGHAGNDTLDGGDGDDELEAMNLYFGESDLLGADTYVGGPGSDKLSYWLKKQAVSVTLDGAANDGNAGEGDNVGSDIEEILGGAGNDVLIGDDGPNSLHGSDGDDQIDGRGGNDTIDGDDGNDTLRGGAGADDVRGGDGNDNIDPGAGEDKVTADDHCDIYKHPDGTVYTTACGGFDEIFVRDGEKDLVLCGRYVDTVVADADDNIDQTGGQHNCETVSRTAVNNGGERTGDMGSASVPSAVKRGALAKKGLPLKGSCSAACTVQAKLLVPKKLVKKLGLKNRVLGKAKKSFAAGAWKLNVPVNKKARKRLKKVKPFKLVVTGTVGATSFKKTVKVK